jgi:hypothetical protein
LAVVLLLAPLVALSIYSCSKTVAVVGNVITRNTYIPGKGEAKDVLTIIGFNIDGGEDVEFPLISDEEVDPAPPTLGGTPPYYPFLLRQTNCSLTQVAIDSNATVQLQNANYQDTLHQALQVPTTADKFPNGCQDRSTGIASQAGAALGKLSNGNSVIAATSADGALVYVISSAGSIASQTDYRTTSGTVFSLATADVNGDGIPDLVVASGTNATSGALTVLLGNSDGTFRTGQSLAVPIASQATSALVGVTIDDGNGDGKLDLIAVTAGSAGSPGISVFLGNGDGTFSTSGLSGPNGAGGMAAVTGDFNGDGKKDIATSYGQLLLGNGDGTFRLGTAILQEGQQPGIAAADFNHDGKLDLAFANSTAATLDVYFGNGDGTFTYASSYPTIDGATSIATSDLDGDGYSDLFVGTASGGVYTASQFSESFFQSVLNYGNGTFGRTQAYFPGPPSQQFNLNPSAAYLQYATANFTGSGQPDLLMTANGTPGAALSVLKGNGDGTFRQTAIQTQLSNPGAPQYINAIASGDMNGDGKPDMVFAWGTDSSGTDPHMSVALGNGDGTFQAQQDYVLPAAVTGEILGTGHSLVLADLKGRGKPDIVFLAGAGLYVMLNNGDGTLAAPTLVDTRPGMSYLAAQSLQGNGKADLVVAQRCNSALLYLGNGDGTFRAAQALNPGFACPNVVAIADVNRDAKPDLVFAGGDANINASSGFVGVFLGNGDGTFQNAKTTTLAAFTGSLPTGIAVAGSSKPGVILGQLGPHGALVVLPGNGDGTFDTANQSSAYLGINSRSLQVADLTGQGLPDLLLSSGGAEANGTQLSVQVFVALPAGAPAPDFMLALNPNSGTSSPGNPAKTTVTITPANGSTQSVALACSGLPSNVSCNFDTPSVTLNGTTASTATVTFTDMSMVNASGTNPLKPLAAGTSSVAAAFCVLCLGSDVVSTSCD